MSVLRHRKWSDRSRVSKIGGNGCTSCKAGIADSVLNTWHTAELIALYARTFTLQTFLILNYAPVTNDGGSYVACITLHISMQVLLLRYKRLPHAVCSPSPPLDHSSGAKSVKRCCCICSIKPCSSIPLNASEFCRPATGPGPDPVRASGCESNVSKMLLNERPARSHEL